MLWHRSNLDAMRSVPSDERNQRTGFLVDTRDAYMLLLAFTGTEVLSVSQLWYIALVYRSIPDVIRNCIKCQDCSKSHLRHYLRCITLAFTD